ncbi:MAG: hypothetical protein CM1200mP30_22930 [Pseudomonadota bacterium]|nr:MAG: hypothetical protein CM1200mP30_22930 [Pseudomonadota bacterium]
MQGEKLNDEDLGLIRDIEKNKTINVINKIDLLSGKGEPDWLKEISGMESVCFFRKEQEKDVMNWNQDYMTRQLSAGYRIKMKYGSRTADKNRPQNEPWEPC